MIRFIMAQPAIKYYSWQVEVLLNNMIEIGINLNYVDVICYIEDSIPEEWDKLRYGYAARFFFYKDTRKTKNYISSIRPNILKQHWENHPYLENEVIFYHDCDIIFTRPLDLDKYKKDDIWYGSDTKWYISYDYIIGKGNDIFNKMIDIIDIDSDIIIKNNDNSIGAQYIMKNVNRKYWEDVEKDCEKLFVEISDLNNKKKEEDPSYHEIQIWCADMWAVLWNAWKRGFLTECDSDLDFSWGTSTEEDYHKYSIMHNAGVTDDKSGLFFKAKFTNEYPYNKDLQIKENTASKRYYDLIKKVEKKSVLI